MPGEEMGIPIIERVETNKLVAVRRVFHVERYSQSNYPVVALNIKLRSFSLVAI